MQIKNKKSALHIYKSKYFRKNKPSTQLNSAPLQALGDDDGEDGEFPGAL